MEQLSLFNEKENLNACVFTGHRELEDDFSLKKLKKTIKSFIEQGVTVFYNGMAMGFDMIAAERVISLRKKFPNVKLIACVPCYGQERYFSEKEKSRYVKILKKADEVVILSDHYYNGCMQARDRYMVERADKMIAYCHKKSGGAAYTVAYFKKKHPSSELVFI